MIKLLMLTSVCCFLIAFTTVYAQTPETGSITSTPIQNIQGAEVVKATPASKGVGGLNFAVFGTMRTSDFDGDYRAGVGIEAGIGVTKNLSITINMLTENTAGSSIDEAGAAIKFAAPLGSALIPYARLGYAFNIETETHYGVVGAGGEIAVSSNFRLFADANWYTDTHRIGHALGRLGVNFSF